MREFLRSFGCHRFPGGLSIWSADPFDASLRVQETLRHLHQLTEPGVEALKQSARRAVLRIRGESPEHTGLVVKGFPLRKLESRIKYQKYGLSEFIHYHRATGHRIPTPVCHAYFEVRSFGFVTANGVLLEDLIGWASLAELATNHPTRRSEFFARAIPLFHLLYQTGVNHIDPSPHNLLLAPTGDDLRLIDWQYCSFLPARQPAQLLFQAAHFLNYAGLPADSPEGRPWLEQLWAGAGTATAFQDFLRAVTALQQRGRISATQRLAPTLDEPTAQLLEESPRHRFHSP